MNAALIAINTNNSIAAANAARAHAQYVADCQFVMEHGESTANNSVAEKQAYAECVKTIYPVEHTSVDPSTKIFVACVLIAMGIGAIIGWIKGDYDLSDKIVLSIFGAIAGVLAVMVAAMIGMGVMMLFS